MVGGLVLFDMRPLARLLDPLGSRCVIVVVVSGMELSGFHQFVFLYL